MATRGTFPQIKITSPKLAPFKPERPPRLTDAVQAASLYHRRRRGL